MAGGRGGGGAHALKLDIIKCYPHLISTDTDSASFQFVFIWKVDCSITEDQSTKLIFDILLDLKSRERLDRFDNFWSQFNAKDKSLKKQIGLYELASIDNHNLIT